MGTIPGEHVLCRDACLDAHAHLTRRVVAQSRQERGVRERARDGVAVLVGGAEPCLGIRPNLRRYSGTQLVSKSRYAGNEL